MNIDTMRLCVACGTEMENRKENCVDELIAVLKGKYPHHDIVNLPLVECPLCKESGEYKNILDEWMVCLCVCLDDLDDIRKIIIGEFILFMEREKKKIVN
jgi:hypothetical protein